MPMNLLLRLFLAWALSLAAAMPALAAQTDRDQPLHIEADAMKYDDVQQTGVFTGNVIVTKGSIQIRAATVKVRQAPDGYQYATAIAPKDGLVQFQERLDTPPGQPEQLLKGAAQRIEYDGKTGDITLVGQADLQRYIGGKLVDRSQGSVIVYNQITDVFTVQGGSGGVTASNPDGRVRVMLSPQPAPVSAPQPAAPPKLQIAPSLGGGK